MDRALLKRSPADISDPKAVDRLRSLTVDSAAHADGMAREKVEMVLLALEILLKNEIEPDASRRAPDANRLMAVLGATTKVAQHPELNSYFDRFKRIALRPLGTTAEAVAARRSPPEYRETMMSVPASPEIVRFSLKLGSWLDMKVTTKNDQSADKPCGPAVTVHRDRQRP